MNALDLDVLRIGIEWFESGRKVYLVTVVSTWGSAPRQPGALMVLGGDGHYVGSVSGGCLEDDLVAKCEQGLLPDRPTVLEYGVSKEEADRFRIPCGGTLRLVFEPLKETASVKAVLAAADQGQRVRRSVNLATGESRVSQTHDSSLPRLVDDVFDCPFGPRWRLLIIGANQLGAVLAEMAQTLEFKVLVCDPRENMRAEWRVPRTQFILEMPDDAVLAMKADCHTAIVAVTHDPKLDDMALLEALKSDAFYVGALGSSASQARRRDRLGMFDLSDEQIARLHGPIGLPIGSRTPAEISISVLAEIVAARSRLHKGAPEAFPMELVNA